jgi:hypothetical protein
VVSGFEGMVVSLVALEKRPVVRQDSVGVMVPSRRRAVRQRPYARPSKGIEGLTQQSRETAP